MYSTQEYLPHESAGFDSPRSNMHSALSFKQFSTNRKLGFLEIG